MSAVTPKANFDWSLSHIRQVSIADIPKFTRSPGRRARAVAAATVRPSVLAVLTDFTTRSNLVGCSTGRSPGLGWHTGGGRRWARRTPTQCPLWSKADAPSRNRDARRGPKADIAPIANEYDACENVYLPPPVRYEVGVLIAPAAIACQHSLPALFNRTILAVPVHALCAVLYAHQGASAAAAGCTQNISVVSTAPAASVRVIIDLHGQCR